MFPMASPGYLVWLAWKPLWPPFFLKPPKPTCFWDYEAESSWIWTIVGVTLRGVPSFQF